MPDGALLAALESNYRPPITHAKAVRTGDKARPASATPAAILSRRAIPKYEPPTRAKTPTDALSITLSEQGKIDLKRMADLLGTTEDGVAKAIGEGEKPLAFYNPETSAWETRNDYLSGQVKRKLAAAKGAGLEKNIAELEAVQPAKWTADQVTALPGANWIPPKVYEDFVNHLLDTRASVNYSKATNSFNLLTGDYGPDKQGAWGTADMPADAIVRGMLNSRVPKVIREDRDGNRYEDKEASALVALKAKEIEREFSDWVFADTERRNQLVDIYNDKFNTRVTRQHDGSHLTLPGKVPDEVIKMRRHQKNAIWRGIYERFMLLDHVVGAGKTFTAIARAMERRRMGLSRKPMVTVPNHLVDQWAADAYRLYPGAKVLAAGKNQFDRQNRRRLFAKIATGDWDLVIVPHSSFGFIGISPDTEMRFLDEELRVAKEAVQEAAEEAAASGLGGHRKPYTVKEAERLVTTIETRMDSLRSRHRDNMLTFEQMGVDDLTVDEAHEFKNLFYSSRLTGVRGMGDKHGSRKAFDLYNKTRVLRESPSGTVTFMSGTPISNSAVEMYSMMRYLAAQDLHDLGLEHFDAWRAQSVSAEPKWEPTEAGGLKEVTRLGRSWSNMRALMELYYSFTDAVPQEDINRWYAEDNQGARFPVPEVKGGGRQEIIVKPTPAQQDLLAQTVEDFNHLPNISDPDERNAARLRLMDRARKLSLDVRAVYPRDQSKEEGGKLDQIANNVARIYKQWNPDKGTQLVFLDRSVPKAKGDDKVIKEYDHLVAKRDEALANGDEETYRHLTDSLEKFNPDEIDELRRAQRGGWNAYDQLKQNLIKRGVAEAEIRFVQEANSDAEKKALFDAVNDGTVRVLVGSTARMGAGTNVQERIVGLHHGDVTWKPSDIEQREGRGIRQGNRLLEKYGDKFALEVLAYATERTVDAKMWDLNSQKLKMINGIRKYNGAFNMDFDDEEAVSMAEIAALASGDPLLLERVKLAGEIDKLEMQERAHRRKTFGIEDAISDAQRTIKDYPAKIEEENQNAAEVRKEIVDPLRAAVAQRGITIEGKRYNSDFEAEAAIKVAVDAQKSGDENAPYSLNIEGNNLTNKAAIEEAVRNAFGDTRIPFEMTIDGEAVRRRWNAGKAIAEKIKPTLDSIVETETKTVPLGKMFGADVSATVEGESKSFVNFVLAVTKEGRTLAAVSGRSEKEISPNRLQGALEKLSDDITGAARSTGAWMQQRIEDAKKALPGLLAQRGQPFKEAQKLGGFRDRLAAIIAELDARTKAAEQRRGHPAEEEAPTSELAEPESRLGEAAQAFQQYRAQKPAEFAPQPNRPLGEQAQDYVLRRGNETGNEHAVGIDATGNPVMQAAGSARSVGFSPQENAALLNPRNSIVIHHNHPANGPLSTQDLSQLAFPGLKSIWAHGHNGQVARAQLTPFGRSLMAKGDVARNILSLGRLANMIGDSQFLPVLQEFADARQLAPKRGDHLLAHLTAETMRRAGLIDYQTSDEFKADIEKFGLEPYIDGAVRTIVRSIPNAFAQNPPSGLGRRAGQNFGHPGELGATFERLAQAPGGHPEQEGPNRPRGEGTGQQAGPVAAKFGEEKYTEAQGWKEYKPAAAAGGGAGAPPPNGGKGTGPAPPWRPATYRALSNRVADLLGSETAIKLKEGLSDYSHRMRLLQDNADALYHDWVAPDGKLPDEQQFYVLKRLFPGKRAARVDVFNKEHFDPLAKFIRQNGIALRDADDYLYAKHAVERNLVKGALYAQPELFGTPQEHQFSRARRDPNVVGASGMSKAQADAIIQKFEGDPKLRPLYQELSKRIAGIRTFIQAEMLRSGLENKETIAEWNRTYENYVPLKEWDDPAEAPDNVTPARGRGRGDIRGPENQFAFGRRTKADSPISHLAAQAYRTIDRAEKNRVLNSAALALASLKRAGAPIEDALGVHLNKGSPKKAIDPETGLVRTVDANMERFGDKAVQFKRNGAPLYMVFDDRLLADAVRRWSPSALWGPFHAILWVTNKMKSMWTHYSPNFLVRHNARYYVESVLNAMELKETGKHSAAAHARQAFPVIGSATRAIFAVERGESPSAHTGDVADLMRSYAVMKEHGGVMAMRTMRDIDQIKEDLRVRMSALGKARQNPIRIWRQGVEAMNHISSVWDNAQRLATMHSALKQGKSPQQAALLGRDATIDYQWRGLWSNMMGLWEPFFNTALRTGFRLGGAVSRSKIMRRVFFGTLAMGFAASAWNYFVGGKDKDGIPFFDKIPDYEKAKGLILLAPWLPDDKGRPSAIKFPFPYNWGGAMAPGYALGNVLWGSQPLGQVLRELVIKPWVSMFSQIGEEGLGVRSVVPEILRPEYDIATNRDWAGRPIHADKTYQKGPNAYSGKGDYGGRVRTGPGWKYIAETLNDFSGGGRHKSGLFDFYPEDIREVLNPYVGTQIGLGNEAYQTGKSIVAGEAPKPTTVPLGRIFYGQDYDAANRYLAFQRSQKAKYPWEQIELPHPQH